MSLIRFNHRAQRIAVALSLASTAFLAAAGEAELPKLVVGDRYVYHQTRSDLPPSRSESRAEFKVGWVSRANKTIILISGVSPAGKLSPDDRPPVYQMLHQVPIDECLVDVTDGHSLVRGRGCKAPLEADEQWVVSDVVAGFPVEVQYTYVGEEQLVVPAGKFKALKFRVATSLSAATLASAAYLSRESAGEFVPRRDDGFLWYAPSIRAKVRSQMRYFKSDGQLAGEGVVELTAFKLKPSVN